MSASTAGLKNKHSCGSCSKDFQYFKPFPAVEAPISQQVLLYLLYRPSSYDLRSMKSAGTEKFWKNWSP